MPGFEHGVERVVGEIVAGIITALLLNAFISSGLLNPSMLLTFKLLNMAATALLLLAMPYWGTVYLVGWLFGLTVLHRSGLVDVMDFVIYFGIPLVILVVRIAREVQELGV